MKAENFLKLIEGVPPIICAGARNPEQLYQVAQIKRFAEWTVADPDFRAAYEKAPQETLDRYGIDVQATDVDCIYRGDLSRFEHAPDEIPEVLRWHYAYYYEKLNNRNLLQQSLCVPSHPIFKEWRQQQISRCWGELGSNNSGFIHVPLVFELAKGCAVQCPFCALSAEKLEGIYRGSTENLNFWRALLVEARQIIGDAAGTGVCYCATEPFDNPDYEAFSRVYDEVFGTIPQVTTAVAMRQSARTKAFLLEAAKNPSIHRFSVLSLEQFRQICDYFTPEDLLFVELLPRFPEATAYNALTKAGRAREESNEEIPAQTISCASGLVVNLVEKSIRITTPCNADAAHPTGEIRLETVIFEDVQDFAEKLHALISNHMKTTVDKTAVLGFQPFYTHHPENTGFLLESKAKFRVHFKSESSPLLYVNVGSLIQQQKWNAREIAARLWEENGIEPAEVFYCINYLYKSGCLIETYYTRSE